MACNHHDFQYLLGCDEVARMKADRQFLAEMLRAAARAPWYKRWRYKLVARAYYAAVRRCGRKHFTYRPWDIEPTLEQLEREVLAKAAA